MTSVIAILAQRVQQTATLDPRFTRSAKGVVLAISLARPNQLHAQPVMLATLPPIIWFANSPSIDYKQLLLKA